MQRVTPKSKLTANGQQVTSPLNLIVQASILESAGRPVTRRVVQAVWPAPKELPGIRGRFQGEEVRG